MNEVWNLDPIYKGFADPAFAEDMERLEKKVAEMTAELAARRGESVPVDEAMTTAQILMGMEAAMDNDMEEEPPVTLPETANAEDDE